MPVYFVQLPGSGAGNGWPYLREQQRLAADMPHSGMVVTVDIDGAGIHPPNKIDVGRRLALWALANDYGKQVAFSGPMFERQEIQGDKIILHFRYADSGLMVAAKEGLAVPREAPDAELAHFELVDKDGVWWPADAKIDGKTVVVRTRRLDLPSPCATPTRLLPRTAICTAGTACQRPRSAPTRRCSIRSGTAEMITLGHER